MAIYIVKMGGSKWLPKMWDSFKISVFNAKNLLF